MLKSATLFSGIGGGELAAEWAGWENVFHCEINPFGQKVLNYYWPNSISYHDITKTDFTIHRGTIDVLTGGFPCQPYSAAGLRKGKEDERHLWPQMLRAIQEIQPRWVVGENVLGITNWSGGLVFEEVQTDLEASGYEVQAYVLPACGVNAPHKRDRVWFVAYANGNSNRNIGEQNRKENSLQKEYRPTICAWELNGTIRGNGVASNADLLRCEWGGATAESYELRGRTETNDLKTWVSFQNRTGKYSLVNHRFIAEMMGFPPNYLDLPFQHTEKNQ